MGLTRLTSLDVSDNAAGPEGAAAVGTVLRGLRSLDISNNAIGDAGVRELAAALTSRQYLAVHGNGMGLAGEGSLRGLTSLTSLCVGGDAVRRLMLKHALPALQLLDGSSVQGDRPLRLQVPTAPQGQQGATRYSRLVAAKQSKRIMELQDFHLCKHSSHADCQPA